MKKLARGLTGTEMALGFPWAARAYNAGDKSDPQGSERWTMSTRKLVAALFASMLVMPILAVPVAASYPTEVYVTPSTQVRDGCPTVSANWTVYLSGGNSGSYTVWVSYGDGTTSPHTVTNNTSGISWGKTFATTCGVARNYSQYWSDTRSGGGGTGHYSTYVYTN